LELKESQAETDKQMKKTDVEKLINKKYENFKILYPEYKNYNHHLGLASFNINESVKDIALKNNVILLQRKDDLIETIIAPSK
jgi:predicted ribosome-associated RNA-binding protein Tma20